VGESTISRPPTRGCHQPHRPARRHTLSHLIGNGRGVLIAISRGSHLPIMLTWNMVNAGVSYSATRRGQLRSN